MMALSCNLAARLLPRKQNDREAVGSAEGSAKRIPDKAQQGARGPWAADRAAKSKSCAFRPC
jgi:hypothetical protein